MNLQGLTGMPATSRAEIIGANGQGKRHMKRDRGAGVKGLTGTEGAGRGRQDSERRDGWWRPEGVDARTCRQAFQDRKRGKKWVQRAVQLSIRVEGGEGVGTQREMGKDPENS